MFDYSKTFLSENRATAFVAYLRTQGVVEVEIWGGTDAFGQHQYTVKWNLD